MSEIPDWDHEGWLYPTPESKLIVFHLGVLSVEWAQLDSMLGFVLGKYMKVKPEHLDVATSVLDMSRKIDLIKALAFIVEEQPVFNRLAKVLTFIDGTMRPLRNRYIHDTYRFFAGENVRTVYRTKIINIQSFKKRLVTRAEQTVDLGELIHFNNDLGTLSQFVTAHFFRLIIGGKAATEELENAVQGNEKELDSKLAIAFKRYTKKT